MRLACIKHFLYVSVVVAQEGNMEWLINTLTDSFRVKWNETYFVLQLVESGRFVPMTLSQKSFAKSFRIKW